MLQERLAAVLEEGFRVLATLELRFIELRGLVLGALSPHPKPYKA